MQSSILSVVVACALASACVPNEKADLVKKKRAAAAAASTNPLKSKSGQRKLRAPRTPRKPGERAKTTAATRSKGPDPKLNGPFSDDFERSALGDAWHATSGSWRIQGGRLCGRRARNHPVWLLRRLPTNARIEFDAVTSSPDGDIKAEFWGDGRSAATTVSYTKATSYLTIFGGWKNRFHVLARIDEHAKDRPEIQLKEDSEDLRAKKVEANRTYHFKVERNDGKTVRWFVDDIELLTYPDPAPLTGPGHEHFGFNDWDVRLCFDNLVVTPLE